MTRKSLITAASLSGASLFGASLLGASLLVLSPLKTTKANASSMTQACARAELDLALLIDQHADRGDIPKETLVRAEVLAGDAHRECEAGREDNALPMYERAVDSIIFYGRAEHSPQALLSCD